MNDEKKNMTFHTHFVHRTLTKIKKLHTQNIVELTLGYSFILYCILAILLFVLLLSMCFCPALVFGLMKCIINNILKFVTWIAALTYEGLQFIFSAAMIAYRAVGKIRTQIYWTIKQLDQFKVNYLLFKMRYNFVIRQFLMTAHQLL